MDVNFIKQEKERKKKKDRQREEKEIKWSEVEEEDEKEDEGKEGPQKKQGRFGLALASLKNKLKRKKKLSPDLASKVDKKAVLDARKGILEDIKRSKKKSKEKPPDFISAEKQAEASTQEPEEPEPEKKDKEPEPEKVEKPKEAEKEEAEKEEEPKKAKEPEGKAKVSKENFFKKIVNWLRLKMKRKKAGPDGDKKKDEQGFLFDVPETNLIKDDLVIFIDWKKNIIMLLIFVGLSFGLVGGAYWGMHKWGQDKEASNLEFEKEFEELDREIKEAEAEIKEILVFKKKLSLAGELLDRHIYWTNFFEFLEDNILTDVYLVNRGFSGNTRGQYGFSLTGKDFGSIEAQIRQFLSSKYVSGVSTGQAQITQTADGQIGAVSFNMELDIDNSIFMDYKKE